MKRGDSCWKGQGNRGLHVVLVEYERRAQSPLFYSAVSDRQWQHRHGFSLAAPTTAKLGVTPHHHFLAWYLRKDLRLDPQITFRHCHAESAGLAYPPRHKSR